MQQNGLPITKFGQKMRSDDIRQLTAQFRTAIEACPKEKLPITFGSFPRGSCGDASLVLGAWLEDNGHAGFEYVLGVLTISPCQSQSHAWLEHNDLIVDITADQFGAEMPAVYVGPSTPFYSKFTVDMRHLGHFRIYDDRTKLTLAAAYEAIKKHVQP